MLGQRRRGKGWGGEGRGPRACPGAGWHDFGVDGGKPDAVNQVATTPLVATPGRYKGIWFSAIFGAQKGGVDAV